MPAIVTAKGQVTVPKPVRDLLGIGPGSQVEFRYAADGSIVLERVEGGKVAGRFTKLLGHAGPGMTTDELMVLLRGEP